VSELVIAALVFITIVGIALASWWYLTRRRFLRERLRPAEQMQGLESDILRSTSEMEGLPGELAAFSPWEMLGNLIYQSGQNVRPQGVLVMMCALGVVAGLAGTLRTGSMLIGSACALFAASAPIVFLVVKRNQRLNRFQHQLPDALDIITRATRAGHALSSGLQLVAEEMPDPLGREFARVVDEVRLGNDMSEALQAMCRRIPLRDVQFLATVIRIQRTSGGNLGEMLDRLASVVRERFKLLSQASAVAAQQKWSAILIGISPIAFAVLFRLMNPRYFDPLLASPHAATLIGAGVLFEVIGFGVIWRISKLKV
jgi:tight adherence protein B